MDVQTATSVIPAVSDDELDSNGRPTRELPVPQLLQMSMYWFGLTIVWAGWEILGQERIEEFFAHDPAPLALGVMEAIGVVVAILVQPTVGNISDYTISRWGRRKPYIFIGTLLDFAFLTALASSHVAIAFFVALLGLQFSSNFAQGPFQGYVPDLVPERQVGKASALVGLMQMFGNIAGTAVIFIGFAVLRDYFWPTIALGLVELLTMLGTVLWVREGRRSKPREGRTWGRIARETWATDVLREHDYVWLVASRFFFMTGAGILINEIVFYLERSLGITDDIQVGLPIVAGALSAKALWGTAATVLFALVVLLVTIPAARASDRAGRKPIVWIACGLGAIGMALATVAPDPVIWLIGVVFLAAASGSFVAVDWAFMTDIIPKISAGRYMGLSNVATASATAAAPALGGLLITATSLGLAGALGGATADAAGPRMAYAASIVLFIIAAILLRPVRDPAAERIAEARRPEAASPATSPI